jgi:hypothetical protein
VITEKVLLAGVLAVRNAPDPDKQEQLSTLILPSSDAISTKGLFEFPFHENTVFEAFKLKKDPVLVDRSIIDE